MRSSQGRYWGSRRQKRLAWLAMGGGALMEIGWARPVQAETVEGALSREGSKSQARAIILAMMSRDIIMSLE